MFASFGFPSADSGLAILFSGLLKVALANCTLAEAVTKKLVGSVAPLTAGSSVTAEALFVPLLSESYEIEP